MSWSRDFVHGEDVVRVSAARVSGGGYEVTVGDRRYEVQARRLPDGRISFEHEGAAHFAAAVRLKGAGGAPDVQARVDGHTWTMRAHTNNRGGGGAGGTGEVAAPMTGTVLSIAVSVGDRVEAADTVAVVTAMKMEHKLTAGIDGEVVEIGAAAGDNVDEGALIVRVE